MKLEGYEEITLEEWRTLNVDKSAIFESGVGIHYFKKVQNFPIVFKDFMYEFEINEEGELNIESLLSGDSLFFGKSLPLLEKALKKIKELKNEN